MCYLAAQLQRQPSMTDTMQPLTQAEIDEALGSTRLAFPMATFDINDVPAVLHQLAPYAERWGVSDDSARESIIKTTPLGLRRNFKWMVTVLDFALDEWLAVTCPLPAVPA